MVVTAQGFSLADCKLPGSRRSVFETLGPVPLRPRPRHLQAGGAVDWVGDRGSGQHQRALDSGGGDIARLSPHIHAHIKMLGRYSFAVPESVARGELRLLRNPTDDAP